MLSVREHIGSGEQRSCGIVKYQQSATPVCVIFDNGLLNSHTFEFLNMNIKPWSNNNLCNVFLIVIFLTENAYELQITH